MLTSRNQDGQATAFGAGHCPGPPPDLPYLARLAAVDFQPVFILGEPRSGTTILYQALGMSGCFNLLTAYHVLCYDRILADHIQRMVRTTKQQINDYLATRNIRTRQFDNLRVSADYTVEYHMVLRNRRHEMALSPGCLDVFDELCRKVQFAGARDQPLLLKNPRDFDRFLYIRSVYPRSKFIFIHRHPIQVLDSQLKLLRSLFIERNPLLEILLKDYARLHRFGLARVLARILLSPSAPLHLPRTLGVRRLLRRRAYYRRHVGQLPAEAYITLRYEDFCADPQRSVEQVLHFLGLQPRQAVDYRAMIERRPRKLEPDVESVQERLCRQFGCGPEENDYTP